ncbi:hypothetical protein NPIL_107231 [Nephila pilipes]|uniref:Uncharacterized protein n=1 Tax=Nephila pilipes TaxID=299642 RepID=A0A8X6NW32_NEPPI|nr:hypothetical protein NPIL_107231 [Nephila pilipes]
MRGVNIFRLRETIGTAYRLRGRVAQVLSGNEKDPKCCSRNSSPCARDTHREDDSGTAAGILSSVPGSSRSPDFAQPLNPGHHQRRATDLAGDPLRSSVVLHSPTTTPFAHPCCFRVSLLHAVLLLDGL